MLYHVRFSSDNKSWRLLDGFMGLNYGQCIGVHVGDLGCEISYFEIFGSPKYDGSVCFCEFWPKMEVSSLDLPYLNSFILRLISITHFIHSHSSLNLSYDVKMDQNQQEERHSLLENTHFCLIVNAQMIQNTHCKLGPKCLGYAFGP
jgi:hypothetical protein